MFFPGNITAGRIGSDAFHDIAAITDLDRTLDVAIDIIKSYEHRACCRGSTGYGFPGISPNDNRRGPDPQAVDPVIVDASKFAYPLLRSGDIELHHVG